jgi:molybdopterin converting factor subunit 1
MRIQVLYFATLRDRAGVRRETLELDEGATLADLKALVAERHAGLAPALDSAVGAVNREFAEPEHPLDDGDEVGLFPPVSGGDGGPADLFRITDQPIDLNDLIAGIIRPTTGAVCSFSGIVRARTTRGEGHQTERLEYEAYEPMAKAKMQQVADEIYLRWPQVEAIAIVQRVGNLDPGTPTVLIACSAAHRDSGVFEAARYGIDRLKQIVPIWKKEIGPEGETWVEGSYTPTADDRADALE